jgi:hypothetical protein
MYIILALARLKVQQAAGHVGNKDLARLFIFQFMQTAFCTAVTQRFPFITGEFIEGLPLPERIVIGIQYITCLFSLTPKYVTPNYDQPR